MLLSWTSGLCLGYRLFKIKKVPYSGCDFATLNQDWAESCCIDRTLNVAYKLMALSETAFQQTSLGVYTFKSLWCLHCKPRHLCLYYIYTGIISDISHSIHWRTGLNWKQLKELKYSSSKFATVSPEHMDIYVLMLWIILWRHIPLS